MEKQASVVLVAAFYSLISAGIAERKARREFVRMLWDNGIKTGMQLIDWAKTNGKDGRTIIDQRWPRKKKDGSLLGPRSAMQSDDPEVALIGEVLYQVEHALIDYSYRENKNLKAQAVADARAEKDVHGKEIAKAFGKQYNPKAQEPAAQDASGQDASGQDASGQDANAQDANLNDDSAIIAGVVDGLDFACEVFADAQEKSEAWARRIISAALLEKGMKKVNDALYAHWMKKDEAAKKAA